MDLLRHGAQVQAQLGRQLAVDGQLIGTSLGHRRWSRQHDVVQRGAATMGGNLPIEGHGQLRAGKPRERLGQKQRQRSTRRGCKQRISVERLKVNLGSLCALAVNLGTNQLDDDHAVLHIQGLLAQSTL